MELDFSEVLFSIAKILHVNAAENPSRCFCSALLSLCTELLLEINVSRIFIQLCAAEGHGFEEGGLTLYSFAFYTKDFLGNLVVSSFKITLLPGLLISFTGGWNIKLSARLCRECINLG